MESQPCQPGRTWLSGRNLQRSHKMTGPGVPHVSRALRNVRQSQLQPARYIRVQNIWFACGDTRAMPQTMSASTSAALLLLTPRSPVTKKITASCGCGGSTAIATTRLQLRNFAARLGRLELQTAPLLGTRSFVQHFSAITTQVGSRSGSGGSSATRPATTGGR